MPTAIITASNDKIYIRIGKQRAFLCEQLPYSDAWQRHLIPPPDHDNFVYTPTMAKMIRNSQPDRIGWYEDENKKKHFFDMPRYSEAKIEYTQWKRLIDTPHAMIYRIPIEGLKKLKELEDKGYQLQFM